MRGWTRALGILAGIAAAVVVVATAALAWRVHAALHPPRMVARAHHGIDREVLHIEEIRFAATDGTRLSGWVLSAVSDAPWIVLCHDVGSGKDALLPLALSAQESGFNVLAFDFRGHGGSEGDASGLGVVEKGDVLGALDVVRERGGRTVGLFGVGMGAHAATLASGSRPEVRVLVLDRLVPDAGVLLEDRVFGEWDLAARCFGFLARSLYAGWNRSAIDAERAEASLARLHDRSVLLLAPATDPVMAARLERMVETIPVSEDHDGNLVTLPATAGGRLYGEDSVRYRGRVLEFFRERMPRS